MFFMTSAFKIEQDFHKNKFFFHFILQQYLKQNCLKFDAVSITIEFLKTYHHENSVQKVLTLQSFTL